VILSVGPVNISDLTSKYNDEFNRDVTKAFLGAAPQSLSETEEAQPVTYCRDGRVYTVTAVVKINRELLEETLLIPPSAEGGTPLLTTNPLDIRLSSGVYSGTGSTSVKVT
jgi:hypothetical protein